MCMGLYQSHEGSLPAWVMFPVVLLSPHELIPQSAMNSQPAPLGHGFYPTYSGSFGGLWTNDALPDSTLTNQTILSKIPN